MMYFRFYSNPLDHERITKLTTKSSISEISLGKGIFEAPDSQMIVSKDLPDKPEL